MDTVPTSAPPGEGGRRIYDLSQVGSTAQTPPRPQNCREAAAWLLSSRTSWREEASLTREPPSHQVTSPGSKASKPRGLGEASEGPPRRGEGGPGPSSRRGREWASGQEPLRPRSVGEGGLPRVHFLEVELSCWTEGTVEASGETAPVRRKLEES